MNKRNKYILAVLLLLVLLSFFAFHIAAPQAGSKEEGGKPEAGEQIIQPEAGEIAPAATEEAEEQPTNVPPKSEGSDVQNGDAAPPSADAPPRQEELCLVTFYGPDGRILYMDEVKRGEDAVPPENPTMPQGYVFSHWKGVFTDVTQDQAVYAECRQFSGEDNVLALGGTYVKKGGEAVLPLELCGDVCLCAFDLRIRYHTEALQFVEFRSLDGSVSANCLAETGEICLNYVSMENTAGEVYLAELVFRAIGVPGQTEAEMEVVELIAFDEDYQFYEPPCSTISGTVTIAAP